MTRWKRAASPCRASTRRFFGRSALRSKLLTAIFVLFELEADGLLSRVIQHENDHLNGRMFTDSLPLPRRTLFMPKLNKLKKIALAEIERLTPLGQAPYPEEQAREAVKRSIA